MTTPPDRQGSLPPRYQTTESSSINLGPLPYFDQNLKQLQESYIQFFQDRVKIEEIYVQSLRRLHAKHGALDSYRDDHSEPSSVRKAWKELGESVERERETREIFLSQIKANVLGPLMALKESQERTRKRIKEDLRDSLSTYQDYADNSLPRLKRSYLKKCQEVEEHKSPTSATSGAGSSVTTAPPPQDNPLHKTSSNPITIGSPTPLRPPSRQPSAHATGTRNRSPSSGTAFADLAHQGKGQLNTIMTFLKEGGKAQTLKEGLAGRPEAALRGVRAKREADEADKEYRKGVHWLETLRLKRLRTLEGGYKSLALFVHEASETMKRVLSQYADTLIATSTTIAQLTSHITPFVEAISASQDSTNLESGISKALEHDVPKTTLYYNYFVGECKDLLFGEALVDVANAEGLDEGQVPRIVELCVKEVEARGLEVEGIYRVSGRHAMVQEVVHKIERDVHAFGFVATDDVSCIASVLKLFLRELPEPLFKFPVSERVQHTQERESHIPNGFPVIRSKIRRLPAVHQATLQYVVGHLANVASQCASNKMDSKNLAIVFGAVIFGEDELPKGGDVLSMQTWKDTVMEDMINHASLLFEDPQEPPLPPAPAGEPVPKFEYGSSYTQMATLPSRASIGDDFNPALPPRPGQSIHPSRQSWKPGAADSVDATSSPDSPQPHHDHGSADV